MRSRRSAAVEAVVLLVVLSLAWMIAVPAVAYALRFIFLLVCA